MKLETAEAIERDNVTEQQVHEVFQDDQQRGDFIILSQQPQVYIQASGEGDGPFSL